MDSVFKAGQVEVYLELNVGQLEMELAEIESEWLKPHETVMYRDNGDEIIVEAMSMMDGDIRTVTTIELKDYVDVFTRLR